MLGWIVLAAAGLLVFALRDALLLASAPRRNLHGLLAGYAALQTATGAGLGAAAARLSQNGASALLADSRLWAPALLVHAGLAWAFLRAGKRRTANDKAWCLVFVPAPAFWICVAALCWFFLRTASGWPGWASGGLLGLAAGALAAGGAETIGRSRRGSVQQRCGRRALRFAAAANLAVVILIPWPAVTKTSPVPFQLIDWESTALTWAGICVLAAAAYLLHRLRRPA